MENQEKGKEKKQVSKTVIGIYCIFFYSSWSIVEFFLKPSISSELIKTGIIKNSIWTVPALLLVYHFSERLYISYKEMFTAKVHWFKWFPLFFIFTVYSFVGSYLVKGELSFSPGFTLNTVIVLLFVGLTEELVFRGWLLNAVITNKNKTVVILVNALLFLLIHFPVWIQTGVFAQNIQSFDFLLIPILSSIFSLSFIKSKSLLLPIALHTYWDFLMFLFW